MLLPAFKTIVVTGGAGFIGSHLIRHLLDQSDVRVVCIDKLGYAADRITVANLRENPRFHLVLDDLSDVNRISGHLRSANPQAVIHLAAESHVDRSIDAPIQCIQNNVMSTANLLQACLLFYRRQVKQALQQRDNRTGESKQQQRNFFRFLQVSTDEVYGNLAAGTRSATEYSPYAPRSPYAASKAAADHLVRAWQNTYGLPTLLAHCSNNYGPRQFPEKLIPLSILKCLREETIPIYGNGEQIRDWLYVDDSVQALTSILSQGQIGETYHVTGNNQTTNLACVTEICTQLDHCHPRSNGSYTDLITHVEDRPGHDRRYAMSSEKTNRHMGWYPQITLTEGLDRTIRWYMENANWWKGLLRRTDHPLRRQGKSGGLHAI